MNTPEKCPFCESPQLLPGKVIGREGYGFQPEGAKRGFVLTVRDPYAFAFGPAAQYCAACGIVWSKADAKDAAQFLEKFGTDELQARLAASNTSPPERKATPAGLRPPAP